MPRARPGHRKVVRAAAHVHSEWSDDASWSLPRIATTFARLGHQVVLMCEHSRGFSSAKWLEYMEACRQASNERVLLVPGIEYGDEDDVVHIPVWGTVPFFGDGLPTGKLLQSATEAAGIAVWAHPWRRDAWNRFQPSWLEHLSAVEVWNRKYDGIAQQGRHIASQARGHPGHRGAGLPYPPPLFPLAINLDLDAAPSEATVYAALADGRVAPRAFGLPLGPLQRGPGGAALRGLEMARRRAARALR